MTNDKTSYIVWFAYQTFVAHREIFEIYFLISKKIQELILHLVLIVGTRTRFVLFKLKVVDIEYMFPDMFSILLENCMYYKY